MLLGIAFAALPSLWAAPRMYVSHASLEIAKAEPGTQVAHPDYMGTQVELLQSGEMMRRALEVTRGLRPDLKEVEVTIHAERSKAIPSVVLVEVSCEESKYAEVFLGNLLTEFIAWHKMYHEIAVGGAINGVIEGVLAAEKRTIGFDNEVKVGRALRLSPAEMEVREARLALARESYETLKKELDALSEGFRAMPPDAVVKQPATPAEAR